MKNLFFLFLLLPFFFQAQMLDSLTVEKEVDSLIGVGQHLIAQQQYEEASKVIDLAESKAVAVFGKEHLLIARCFSERGILFYKKARYADSESCYIRALQILEKSGGKMQHIYASNLGNLASLYSKIDRYKEAEEFYLESKKIFESLYGNKHLEYRRTLNNLAAVYEDIGRYEESESLLLESIAVAGKKDDKMHTRSLRILALLYFRMANYEKAEQRFSEVKNLMGNDTGKMDTDNVDFLNDISALYSEIGDYKKSEECLLEAKNIQEKMTGKEHPDYAGILNNLANHYRDIGSYEKAEFLFLEAMGINEKLIGKKHTSYAINLNNLAIIYKKKGEYEKAEPLYWEAASIYEEKLGKSHPFYAGSLINLANLYSDINNYEKAEPLYLEAKSLMENAKRTDHSYYANGLNSLGVMYLAMGDQEKAEHLYIESKNIREKSLGKEHPNYEKSLKNLANFYRKTGNYEKSEPLYIELCRLVNLLVKERSSHLSENELLKFIQLYIDRSNNFLSFAGERNNLSPPMVAAAWDNTLFSKGLLLENTRALEKFAAKAPDTLRHHYFRWKSLYRRLAAEYAKPVDKRKNVPELEAQADSLEKILVYSAADFADTRRDVTWRDVQNRLRPDEAVLEFVHYQYHNRETEATDSVLYAALVLRPRGTGGGEGWDAPKWVALFEEKQLDSMFLLLSERKADYVNNLYTPAKRGIVHTAPVTLHQLIWQPLEKELMGVKNIYFSPTGLLHRLNLAAIPISADSALADKYHLIQLGSTRQLASKNQPDLAAPVLIASAEKSAAAILFGGIRYDVDSTSTMQTNSNPETREAITGGRNLDGEQRFSQPDSTLRGETWQYLPFTEKEVTEVEKTLKTGAVPTQTLKGYRATEEAFKMIGRNEPSPQILHIATHGFFFPDPKSEVRSEKVRSEMSEPVFKISDNPMMRSGLLLAGGNHAWQTGGPPKPNMEDGILTAYEISQMNLAATELVVLSACETGLGDIQGNEGVYGLQRAFKMAGAKYLIMSLWQVQDKPTSLLMTTFYKKWLMEKMEIPDAFRAAQREMREIGFEPYQWAGFVLVE